VCVFLPVDRPLVSAASLRALGEACADAAVAQDGSPLPAAYRRSTLPVWEGCLADELSLRGALAGLEVRTAELDLAELIDVNSPDDLRGLR
jgi:molybdopterin-guanine dinucleotide biosynthesis protein A